MRAVVTVSGKDKVGIVASVATKLQELDVNILEITQTLLSDYFTMMLIVKVPEKIEFLNLRQELDQLGLETGLKIMIQNEEIFGTMHSI